MSLDPKSTPAWKEEDRLKAIESYDILDTPREEEFDDIVKMAAEACNVPVSLISFVTSGRQWFKAALGTDLNETPLNMSICSQAIQQNELFVIPDTTKDDRTIANPLVSGDPHVRFYAGALLKSPEGLPLGTVCVLDYKPRTLSKKEESSLKALARHVMTQLELRRTLSDLRRALAAKSQSEDRLSLALDASGFVGTWEWDVVRDRVYADQRFVASFGGELSWTTEGAPVSEYIKAIHPDDLERINAAIEQTLKRKLPFQEEYRLMRKDGSFRWIEARGRCHFEGDTPIRFPGVAIDVTEKKNNEAKAREAAERFQFMAESLPHKMWTATPQGDISFFNRQWMQFTGLTFEQIRDWGWVQFIHPEDLDETLRIYKEAIATVKPFEMQQRLRRKDGVYRWHLARGTPMFDSDGKLMMWMGTNTDISDLRDAQDALHSAHALLGDKATLLEEVVQQRTQKLSETIDELEAFSYSISHDMRAPLRSMIGYIRILQEDHGPSLNDSARDYLGRISNASERMDQLIQDVLIFSRVSREDIALVRVDIDTLIKGIIQTYPNLHTDKADITINFALPPVVGNASLLSQCFANLLDNGSKFAKAGEKGRIEVTAEIVTDKVKIYFKDHGIGMSEHSLERIFDIFQRVGRETEGTGIGLAIVRKAAEKMGGSVGVKSKLGQGSIFWLELQSA